MALDRGPEGTAPMFYAATRTTFSPNIAHSGVKLNVIPDSAEVDIDIRTIAGDDGPKVREMLREAIGDDLWKDVEITAEGDNPASESPTRTPLWDTLTKVTQKLVPGAETIPFLIVGATDARYFRRKGVTAYGYGLMSERISFKDFAKMFHGNNERIDQESLRLSTELFEQTAREWQLVREPPLRDFWKESRLRPDHDGCCDARGPRPARRLGRPARARAHREWRRRAGDADRRGGRAQWGDPAGRRDRADGGPDRGRRARDRDSVHEVDRDRRVAHRPETRGLCAHRPRRPQNGRALDARPHADETIGDDSGGIPAHRLACAD